MAMRWSPDHLRLHRLLRRRPALLPAGGTLLLAVSGGQDSMALLGLLHDLARLHGWSLLLWHGDHRWRPEAAGQAAELAAWARARGLALTLDRWEDPGRGEAAARQWRYGCLAAHAAALGACRVVTGHTASDRAETLLLQLARGSHRRGLGNPRALRELVPGIQLARPLLLFSRDDTARICRALQLPIWWDPSNAEPVYGRNRIRQEVLPVLEALHPGASRRLGDLSERLAEEDDAISALVDLALAALAAADRPDGLDRRALLRQPPANGRLLLRRWLVQRTGAGLGASQLEQLLVRLRPERGPGRQSLAAGQVLCWDRRALWLAQADELP